ncbi:eIF2A-related protein [Anabaena sp. WFMT]|uniref:eIF2A-related protein n=1 Tax=Anabaena sp. WFMT TaxID=3449730 RepID=UPI003F28AB25
MNNQESPPGNNDNSLRTILRAINFSQGQLSLIFLRCNYAKLRQQIAAQLKEVSSIPIREITLPESSKSLYNNISQELADEQPQAVMISGLDSVKNIDAILSLSNQIREEFRKNFPFPILIWIDDQILKKIIRVAPDLENWGSIIDFENDTDDLIDLLQETTEEIFNHDVTPNPQVYKEIESAHQDLQDRGEDINPEIQAGLDLAFGLREYQQDHLDNALIYYQRSREFWQIHNHLERHGMALVKISSAYTRKAEISNTENKEDWQNARDNLQQALEIFEQAERLDLVIEYNNHLGEILRQLKSWNDLESFAQKSLKLYENLSPNLAGKGVRGLGQNYGFLAEVALKNKEWLKANQYAQKALDILANIPNLPSQEYGLYRLFFARSQIGLGDNIAAIETLEIAKNESHPQYNPKLYIDILEQLNFLYFQEKQYLKAFTIKQKRLQVKQQYGFVAFIGASYLNPQRKVIKSENSEVENTGIIAQEISASGREEDVKRLRGRIAGNEHKLTVIHGQSGVGKSSILQGGLIPALQQEPIGEREALPILLRVYTNWLEILGESLKSNISNVGTIHELPLHSTDAIIQQLRKNENRNLLTVLIFDQFEEFFFVYSEQKQRRQFYDFLRVSLDIPFVKIVLSLREDYLHYLLELDRLVDLTVTNNNILDKNIRYYLGNFSPADAKAVIKSLTEKTRFYLQAELIDELVKDLAGDIGEVRPIELQIVGTQLQTEQIKNLDKYQEFGKEKLVEKFLEDVIKDCGAENEQIARLVLYLLTDENGTRPLKTRAELVEQLAAGIENLDLILNIFVASGLVLLLPESPADRYQLVHDYLVEFIRQQQGNELLAKLAKAEAELKQEQEARQIVENAKLQADAQIKEGQKRLKLSSALAVGLVIISGIASVYGMNQFSETKKARTKQDELQQQTQQLVSQTKDLELKSQQAEENKKAAEIKFTQATQETQKAQQNLSVAKTTLVEVNKQAAILKQKNTEAESKIQIANASIKIAEDKSQQASKQQTEAEQKVLNAQGTFKQANDAYLKSLNALEKADKAIVAARKNLNTALKAQQEALLVTKLEQGGVNVLRQFQFEELPALVSAVQNGKTLKTLVKNSPLDKYPTISPIYALNNILDNIKDRNQFKGHQSEVWGVSFSPDGKTIATASSDNTARLWNLKGELLREFKGHQGYVWGVSFSPDGKTIATASWDNTARLWNLQGELLQEFKGHQERVTSVSFSPDGKTIATGSGDKTARLWNLQGQLLREFKGHQSEVWGVSFSPDGKTIATASLDHTARLWNLQGQLLREFKGHQEVVTSVSFSPDGKTIATGSWDNTARLWNLQGELLREFKGHQGYVNSVSFNPDGQTIATASLDNTARLWNLQGELLHEFKGHQEVVTSVSFSPDGKTIATASWDKTVRLWNLKGQKPHEFKGHQEGVNSVSFSPDGKTIATASGYKTVVRLWNLQGELLQEFKGHQERVTSVSFSPDGKTIATASGYKTVRFWNLRGELLQEFKGHQGYFTSVSFSPDGKTIVTASRDNTARLWNLRGELLQEFKGHQGYFTSVSFSPDGKTIATASGDNTARLWNLKGELLQEFKGHQNKVRSVSFSPDGKTIATASGDNTARLWNLKGELLQEFKGHQSFVISVSFSPDGKTIVTASGDNTARLWNLKGELLQEFKGHQGYFTSVSFSSDGKTIATASDDKTARLWPVRNLDRLLVDGCDWLKYYLHNPGINLSPEDRRLCDDVKLSESGFAGFKD